MVVLRMRLVGRGVGGVKDEVVVVVGVVGCALRLYGDEKGWGWGRGGGGAAQMVW